MERKSILPVLFLIVMVSTGEVLAQTYYPIIAAKGRSGLIRTPVDRVFKVGEEFEVVRPSIDYSWRVAVVRVVLVEKKYIGLKIVKPINDHRIQKHDLLKVQELSYEEKLKQLEKKSSLVEPAPSNPPGNHGNSGELAAKNPVQAPASGPVAGDLSSPESGNPAVGGYDQAIPLRPVRRYNRPFIGPVVSLFFPINQLSSEFQAGPQFGLQLMTPLHKKTFLRVGMSWLPLRPQAAPTAINRAYLLTLTGTAMPHLTDMVFLEVGAGFYRQVVDQTILGTTVSSVDNALALIGGAGLRLRLMDSGHLILSATGNLYFPRDSYRTYLSLAAGWYFGF